MDDHKVTQVTSVTPVTPVTTPPSPAVPVGGRKEADVSPDVVAKAEGDEYWENYAREIELEKEVMEIGGVEKVESGEVKIPEKIAKEMGVRPTVGPQTPIATATGFSIRGVTLSDDQIGLGLKKPTSTGWRWLVEWFIYQLLKAHYFVKKVHGKITRKKVSE
ncbi:hypothetical protein HY440_00525 [Candidatus Microgenomates bacterium]|nr:hypothetical protein [Candidatus Microgenomates bacterium]